MTREQKSLKDLVNKILDRYGEDILADTSNVPGYISTGSITLDLAIGGGLPKGRICDLYGSPSAGKSMIAISAMAKCQQSGGVCAYFDLENSYDKRWASILGVDHSPEKFVRLMPRSAEEVFNIIEELLKSKVDLIVVDSTAALIPEEVIERTMEENTLIGVQARVISKGLQKITPIVARSQSVVLFINQTRKAIGNFVVEEDVPTGGSALSFYSSVRIKVSRKDAIKEKDKLLGHKIHCLVKKNKINPPMKTAEFDLLYDKGIDNVSELLDCGLQLKIIEHQEGGQKYNFKQYSWRGYEKAKEAIKSSPEIQNELFNDIKNALASH